MIVGFSGLIEPYPFLLVSCFRGIVGADTKLAYIVEGVEHTPQRRNRSMATKDFSAGLKAVLDQHGYGFQYAVLNKCRELFESDQDSPWWKWPSCARLVTSDIDLGTAKLEDDKLDKVTTQTPK